MNTTDRCPRRRLRRIPVFDERGTVRAWLAAGRGVQVWRNCDLSSPEVGGLAFTPADRPGAPHWRYGNKPESVEHDLDRFVFYRRSRVVAHWTDTPAGQRAAQRHCPADRTETVPIGRMHYTYTVESILYQTVESIPFPLAQNPNNTRPLDTQHRACVVEWVACDRASA